jgi:hypothetical protein
MIILVYLINVTLDYDDGDGDDNNEENQIAMP